LKAESSFFPFRKISEKPTRQQQQQQQQQQRSNNNKLTSPLAFLQSKKAQEKTPSRLK
jgi:hypothetical protein